MRRRSVGTRRWLLERLKGGRRQLDDGPLLAVAEVGAAHAPSLADALPAAGLGATAAWSSSASAAFASTRPRR